MNKIGVPIILVGTQAALETLTSDVATARRFSGANGAVIMDLLEYGSDEWEMLLCGLQKYQLYWKTVDGWLYRYCVVLHGLTGCAEHTWVKHDGV